MSKMAKGPFMEFLRAEVLMETPDVYAEVQIPTPTSKTENMAMLIHSIELEPSTFADPAPVTLDTLHVQLTKRSKTELVYLDDPDLLAHFAAFTILNAVFHAVLTTGHQKTDFNPPILCPKANLYFGIDTNGFTSIMGARCRISYTLEKVSREDFISALVE
ncbi:hypothetical protein ES705_43616 [subsurface metagenome]